MRAGLCICQQSWILPICILFIEMKIGTFRIASIPSGGGVGIMNSPRVTKGYFNSPWVAKSQVVEIEIDLNDKWRIHHPYPSSWRDFHCHTVSGNSLQMIGKFLFMVPNNKFSLTIKQCQEQWVSSIFFMDLYCNFVLPTICLDRISVKICMFNGWARFETVRMLRNKSEKILHFFFSKEVPKIF